MFRRRPFSILERIDVGETQCMERSRHICRQPFSILERIDVGETRNFHRILQLQLPFSILERIDVGETASQAVLVR